MKGQREKEREGERKEERKKCFRAGVYFILFFQYWGLNSRPSP
jgi:hypothetical protein